MSILASATTVVLMSGCTGNDRRNSEPPTSPSPQLMNCGATTSEGVADRLSILENGLERGWLAAAIAEGALAIEQPTYLDGLPSGTEVTTVDLQTGEIVTGVRAELAKACLDEVAVGIAERPTMTCAAVDLSTLNLNQDQEGPARKAYGSTIVGSAAVDAGDGYEIVALKLAKPTGPGHADRAAWIRQVGNDGWLVPVSATWQGAGTPEHRAVVWGQAARAAALDCLD